MSQDAMPGEKQATDARRAGERDDVGGLLVVANIALVGVPGAYATSGSLAVTMVAAGLAVVLIVASLRRRPL